MGRKITFRWTTQTSEYHNANAYEVLCELIVTRLVNRTVSWNVRFESTRAHVSSTSISGLVTTCPRRTRSVETDPNWL